MNFDTVIEEIGDLIRGFVVRDGYLNLTGQEQIRRQMGTDRYT